MAPRNMTAVTRLVSPVLPPSAIPALDSTTVVTVDVPTIAPASVETASDINACFIRITSPFLSIIPDCLAAPRSVPIESNILTRKETSAKSLNFTPRFISRFDSCVIPRGMPMRVAATIPSRIDPFTLLA